MKTLISDVNMQLSNAEEITGFFKALSNLTRLRIVAELAENDKCVSDVENIIGTRQANISQHLAVLKKYGVVDCRRDGNMRCYFLRRPEVVKNILRLLEKKE